MMTSPILLIDLHVPMLYEWRATHRQQPHFSLSATFTTQAHPRLQKLSWYVRPPSCIRHADRSTTWWFAVTSNTTVQMSMSSRLRRSQTEANTIALFRWKICCCCRQNYKYAPGTNNTRHTTANTCWHQTIIPVHVGDFQLLCKVEAWFSRFLQNINPWRSEQSSTAQCSTNDGACMLKQKAWNLQFRRDVVKVEASRNSLMTSVGAEPLCKHKTSVRAFIPEKVLTFICERLQRWPFCMLAAVHGSICAIQLRESHSETVDMRLLVWLVRVIICGLLTSKHALIATIVCNNLILKCKLLWNTINAGKFYWDAAETIQ